MSLNGYHFGSVGIYGMFSTFSEQVETVLFQISNQITSFGRHV